MEATANEIMDILSFRYDLSKEEEVRCKFAMEEYKYKQHAHNFSVCEINNDNYILCYINIVGLFDWISTKEGVAYWNEIAVRDKWPKHNGRVKYNLWKLSRYDKN